MSSPFSFRVAPNASEAASTLPPCSWKISAAQAPTLPNPCFHHAAVKKNTLHTGKQMMRNLLHEVILTIMAVLWAFMCQQSHAAHLHSAKCVIRTHEVAAQSVVQGRQSVAAAAALGISTAQCCPPDTALGKRHADFDHIMSCCAKWTGPQDVSNALTKTRIPPSFNFHGLCRNPHQTQLAYIT